MKVLITENQLADKIRSLGLTLSRDYEGKNPLLVGCLKGSLVFLSDLIRQITVPHTIDFVRISTYGKFRTSSENVQADLFNIDVKNRHVIIIEDIIDTGMTLDYLTEALKKQTPNSLKVCTLLFKPGGGYEPTKVDYQGVDIGNDFVGGYGLDWNERYRSLPYIAIVSD